MTSLLDQLFVPISNVLSISLTWQISLPCHVFETRDTNPTFHFNPTWTIAIQWRHYGIAKTIDWNLIKFLGYFSMDESSITYVWYQYPFFAFWKYTKLSLRQTNQFYLKVNVYLILAPPSQLRKIFGFQYLFARPVCIHNSIAVGKIRNGS